MVSFNVLPVASMITKLFRTLDWFIPPLLAGCVTTGGGVGGSSVVLPLPSFDGRTIKTHDVIAEPLVLGKLAPTILVAHGCDGMKSTYRRDGLTYRTWGYNVVLVDSFALSGKRSYCNGFSEWIEAPSKELMAAYLQTVAKWVSKQPWQEGKIGAIGFSMGGGAVLALSAPMHRFTFFEKSQKPLIEVVVAYYPGCQMLFPHVGDADIPVLAHFGGQDDWTPLHTCKYVKRDGKTTMSSNFYDVRVYPNATHAWNYNAPARRTAGFLLMYDPVATVEAERATREFFDKHLRGR
jgi:dienelactone hydrolase